MRKPKTKSIHYSDLLPEQKFLYVRLTKIIAKIKAQLAERGKNKLNF